MERASGRYTLVWKKTVQKNDKTLDENLRAYVRLADKAWEAEHEAYGDRDLGGKDGYTSADVQNLAGVLNNRIKRLADGEDTKAWEKGVKKGEEAYRERKKKYETAKAICGQRNRYSNTDEDAPFMRMTEAHMGNGHLKPPYHVQIGTDNGFVVGYDIFANPADTRTLKPHLRRQKKRLGKNPKALISDAGYGSEEHDAYFEKQGTVAVVPYNTWRNEKSNKWQEDVFRSETWEYTKKENYYVCPAARNLRLKETKKEPSDRGYTTTLDIYEGESCQYCRMNKPCSKAPGNRQVQRNETLLRLRRNARKVLDDDRYVELRKRRSVEVETVFGQINGNLGYRRFRLRGMKKVTTAWGLLVLGYTMKQLYRLNRDKRA